MARALASPHVDAPLFSAETGSAVTEGGPPPTESDRRMLDDRLARAIGIPLFGLAIPRLTGLTDGRGLANPVVWLGTALFVALAAAIWHGNRWLLFEQRRRFGQGRGWFDHPAQKVMLLLAANVLYTVPITIVGLLVWYAIAGQPADAVAIRTVVLVDVLCVVFVSHAYETVFLVKERESDLVRVAQLDRARVEAELSGFLAQVDPHFLFNSLNTLGHLIDTDTSRARRFADMMGDLYRYLLRQRGRSMVSVDDELAFVHEYVELMQIRLGAALRLVVVDRRGAARPTIPPTALQLLVENAIKHNAASEADPLVVEIGLDATSARVHNRRRPRRSHLPSEGVGLRNLAERVRLATGETVVIEADDAQFTVVVPLGAPPSAEARDHARALAGG
jgi:hypothetical protein